MVFVTNSHCNVVIPAPICGLVTPGIFSDEWVHPGLFEQMGTPYQIGHVAGHAAPTCPGNNNLTDATKVTSPSTLTSMGIRDVPFYPSITPGDPLPGDPVQKSGRTTGFTLGVVTAINVTIAVPANGGYCCGPLTMKQQIEWQPQESTAPGDSGSSLLSTEAPPRVVGLNWGGDGTYTYANHIDNVLSALNVSLNPTACLSDCIYARAARTLPPISTEQSAAGHTRPPPSSNWATASEGRCFSAVDRPAVHRLLLPVLGRSDRAGAPLAGTARAHRSDPADHRTVREGAGRIRRGTRPGCTYPGRRRAARRVRVGREPGTAVGHPGYAQAPEGSGGAACARRATRGRPRWGGEAVIPAFITVRAPPAKGGAALFLPCYDLAATAGSVSGAPTIDQKNRSGCGRDVDVAGISDRNGSAAP